MLGNRANCLPRAVVLLTMLITVWGFCPEDGDEVQVITALFPCTTAFTRAHTLPGLWQGEMIRGQLEMYHSCGSVEKASFSGFFSTWFFCDLLKLLGKWRERVKCGGLWEWIPTWCRYFLPDSSKMVIHRTGCTFLSAFCSLKSQCWQTQSAGQLLHALPWV